MINNISDSSKKRKFTETARLSLFKISFEYVGSDFSECFSKLSSAIRQKTFFSPVFPKKNLILGAVEQDKIIATAPYYYHTKISITKRPSEECLTVIVSTKIRSLIIASFFVAVSLVLMITVLYAAEGAQKMAVLIPMAIMVFAFLNLALSLDSSAKNAIRIFEDRINQNDEEKG